MLRMDMIELWVIEMIDIAVRSAVQVLKQVVCFFSQELFR